MRLTRQLIRHTILPALDNPYLRPLADAAVLPWKDEFLVVSTDSFVVSPLFFPGGDIGSLAVHGTVNDLVAVGARPLWLTVGLIIEEGLPVDTLQRVLASLANAARASGLAVVAGDTKVVPRGAADKLFVNVTGLGRRRPNAQLGTQWVRPGDRLIVSGTVGDHGMAILSAREALEFQPPLTSDSAALDGLLDRLWEEDVELHFLRDPTRGGVAAVLHELCEAGDCGCFIEESAVPVAGPVRSACELLGLDPLLVANEGKMVLVVSAQDAARTVALLREHPLGRRAAEIGAIVGDRPPEVLVRGPFGMLRALDDPRGAPLPRIC
jgi:hydrogenase expression/formation protein HypE